MAAEAALPSGEYCVLAMLVEAPRHGWALSSTLAREGELGSIWTMARPLVYTSLRHLESEGHIKTAGLERGERGPHRVIFQATPEGKRLVEQWLGRPVEHVRDIRSLFLLKVVLTQRLGYDVEPLLVAQRAVMVPFVAWLEVQARRRRSGGRADRGDCASVPARDRADNGSLHRHDARRGSFRQAAPAQAASFGRSVVRGMSDEPVDREDVPETAPRTRRESKIATACALVAILVGSLTAAAVADGHGVTALVGMRSDDPIAAIVPSSFSFVGQSAHYDGVYYYAMARDPLALGSAHKLIDRSAYRYGNPGYGWLAWAASGGGQPAAVPYALLIVGLLALALAAWAASVLAVDFGMSPWWGLSVGLSPGLLFALSADCSEPAALACALLAALAWDRKRWLAAGAAIALGCFVKEPLLLVPVAIAGYETYRCIAARRIPKDVVKRAAALVVGPVLYVFWVLYCRSVFGQLPSSGIDQLQTPPWGWITTIRLANNLIRFGDSEVGYVTAPLLVSFGALLVICLVRAVRLRTPVDAILAAFAILAFFTNAMVLLYPKDFIRTAALPLALVPFVLGFRSGALRRG